MAVSPVEFSRGPQPVSSVQYSSTEYRIDLSGWRLYEKFGKPILLTEFGAEAIPGHHAQPPEMFSEEYQAEMLVRYIELLRQKPYVVGEHIWNLCDFKTSQGITRAGGLNYKGVFTRDRHPKLAAHRVRDIWRAAN